MTVISSIKLVETKGLALWLYPLKSPNLKGAPLPPPGFCLVHVDVSIILKLEPNEGISIPHFPSVALYQLGLSSVVFECQITGLCFDHIFTLSHIHKVPKSILG